MIGWLGRQEDVLGLGAENVAAIDPLLVTYNSKGEVEGVKYDRIVPGKCSKGTADPDRDSHYDDRSVTANGRRSVRYDP